jgi:hypothetical protein
MSFSRSVVLRRWYFLSLSLALVTLVVLRFTLLSVTSQATTILQSLAGVTDNLIAATMASLIVGGAYVLLFPADVHTEHEVVRSIDIAQVIADECRTAREWSVRSRGANYFTTVTLSDLIASALATGRAIRVRVESIDPENAELLEGYARSMSDISSRVGTWSAQRARREIYASLLRAAIKCRDAPRVDVQFGLSPSLWVMSLDISDQAALVTCQNKGDDALVFRSNSQFYRPYCDDFEASWRACRIVTPRLDHAVPADTKELTDEHYELLNKFFKSLDLPERTRVELEDIVRTLGREHDYA